MAMSESSELPPKTEVALALLQTAMSVYVHLDPRPREVRVPASFKKQAQLVLQVGLNMAVPIPDLDVGTEALTCTLSFNRKPEYCWIPWSAIYGLVGDDGRGMIWPDSVPPEVAAAAEGRPSSAKVENKRPRLRVAGEATESSDVEGAPQAEQETATPAKRTKGARDAKKAAAALSQASRPEAVPPTVPQVVAAAERASEPDASRSDPDVSAGRASRQSPVQQGKRELPPYLRIVK